jgi:hypothetical protein
VSGRHFNGVVADAGLEQVEDAAGGGADRRDDGLAALAGHTPSPYVVEGVRATFAGHDTSGALDAGADVSPAFAVAAVTAGTGTFIHRHA